MRELTSVFFFSFSEDAWRKHKLVAEPKDLTERGESVSSLPPQNYVADPALCL
jgi:hypothetical protein